MGFWNRLFASKGAPVTPSFEQLSVRWPELAAYLEKEQAALVQPVLPQAVSSMQKIKDGFQFLEKRMEKLFQKPLETPNPALPRIAKQMRENYVKRAQHVLAGLYVPPQPSYSNISEFHRRVLDALTQLNKVAADNRYLIGFYREDFEVLGKEMQELAREADALKVWLENLQPRMQAYEQALQQWKQANDQEHVLFSLQKRRGDLQASLNALPRVNESEWASLRQQQKTLGQQAEALASEISRIKSHALELLLPLQRLFRKFERLSLDKKMSGIARLYSEDPWIALQQEPSGQPLLKELLRQMRGMIEKRSLVVDAKDLEKFSSLARRLEGGELDEFLSRLQKLEQEMALVTRQKEELASKLREWESLHSKTEALTKEMEALSSQMEAQQKSLEKTRSGLQEFLKSSLNHSVAFVF